MFAEASFSATQPTYGTYPSTIIDHRALAQRPEALALALMQLILQIHDAGDRHHERRTSYYDGDDKDDEALPPVLSYRRADEYLATDEFIPQCYIKNEKSQSKIESN